MKAIISYGYIEKSYYEPDKLIHNTFIEENYTDKWFMEWIESEIKKGDITEFHIIYKEIIKDKSDE